MKTRASPGSLILICLHREQRCLSLGRYLCWWTISPRGYLSSSQCFDTDMVYQIYALLKFTVPK